MTRIIIDKKQNTFVFKNQDLHTKEGYLKKEDIVKAQPGDTLKTNIKREMIILEAAFIDLYNKIKRGPQIIPRKDVGTIIVEVGLQPNWKIVDAGAGCGALSCFLANLVPKGKVYTYDVREDHLAITEKNIELLSLKNITAKKHDIYEGIPIKDIDLITLDVPEPWNVVPHAEEKLKVGGFLVSYSPCVPQVSDFVEAVYRSEKLVHLKTIEMIQREWEFVNRKQRPATQQLGHSGFITFCRKIKN